MEMRGKTNLAALNHLTTRKRKTKGCNISKSSSTLVYKVPLSVSLNLDEHPTSPYDHYSISKPFTQNYIFTHINTGITPILMTTIVLQLVINNYSCK